MGSPKKKKAASTTGSKRKTKQTAPGRFVYFGTSESLSTAQQLRLPEMRNQGVEVTLKLLTQFCDITPFTEKKGYETDPRKGLTLERDICVSFYRSKLGKTPCYYARDSHAEYLWLFQTMG